jgi:hypothetical protein
MNISYEGIGELVVTVPVALCQEGHICRINTDGRAEECDAGEKFCGLVLAEENGTAAVQLEGFIKVGYSGSRPMPGYVTLAGDGNGKVMTSNTGREYLVVASNQDQMEVIIKL